MGFDLKKNLVFYGAYHRDPTNVNIHVTCVPILLATGFFFGSNTPSLPLSSLPPKLASLLLKSHLPLNLCTIAGLTYSTSYLLLSPNLAGYTLAPLVLLTSALSNRLHSHASATPGLLRKVNFIAIAVHVVSWVAQFVGHGKYEGRKPALLDNLVQALGLAPLFVWYETLWRWGLMRGLEVEVKKGVDEEVKKIQAAEKR